MKILHVFSLFSLKYGGGTVDVVYKLTQALQKRGHDISIYTSDYLYEGEYDKSLNGVKLHTFESIFCLLPFKVQVHSFLSIFNFTPDLLQEAHDHLNEFDIIHFHAQRSIFNVILYYYARKYKIPYIIDSHGSSPFLKRAFFKKLYDKLIGKRMYDNCSRFIAESPVGVQEYIDIGLSNDKITIIQPPMMVEEYDKLPHKGEFRERYGIKEKYIITFVGRINWIKGLDLLVNAFDKLLKQENDVKLVIVGGDDGAKTDLEKQISSLGIEDKVFFAGFKQGHDKLSVYVDSDLVVQPSRYEQGAWMPLEAILCGTPIIVSEGTGSGDDVKRINAGYVVDCNDVEKLASTMLFVLNHSEYGKLAADIGAKWVRDNLNITNNIRQYEQVYKEVIGGR